MTARPRMKIMAGCLAVALAQWAAGNALADSAVGVDTALGNALNPPGRSAVPRPIAPDGYDTVRHSPSGQLYGVPYDRSDEGENKTEGGWEYSGGIDVGVLSNDAGKKSALFRKYKDLKDGPYLDYFEVEADKPGSAHFIQTFGGGTGQHDQFYGMQFGRYNDWKVKLFYNEIQHVFTDTYKPVFNGSGTGNLTLAGGLMPNGGASPVISGAYTAGATNYIGATSTCTAAAPCWSYGGKVYSNATALTGINWIGTATAAPQPIGTNTIAGSINSFLNTVPADTELSLVRKKGGVQAELKLTDFWKGYASYSQENRTGARPFGVTENNYNVEIPEPIDYTTHDFLAGLSYTDSLTQVNVRASASIFRNNISTLTVQQPWLSTNTLLGAAQTAIFDLYPDNEAFNLKGEFARILPDFYKGRLTANASWGTSRQDDTLQMPVDPTQSAQIFNATGLHSLPLASPGYSTVQGIDLRNWDGTNGLPLSQATAKQRIDTKLLNLGLSLKPVDELSLRGDFRYYESDNKGGYIAYNPLTGQFGRGFIRSTSFDLVVGSAGTPGATGAACYTLSGYPLVPGCQFAGNLGGIAQVAPLGGTASANNPGNVPVYSPARDTKQINYVLSADYDLGKGGSANGIIEREEFQRTYRERDKTWEDKIKVGYVNRGFELATLRLSYEDDRRRGSAYNFWPVYGYGTGLQGLDWNTIYTQYLKTAGAAPGWTVASANMAGYFANRYNYEMRKYDQADRDQQILNTRVNLMPREDIDLGLSLQRKDVKYPNSGYGLEKDRMTSVNFEANYQPSTERQIYGYYSWQDASKSMRANSGFTASGTASTTACTTTTAAGLTLDQFIAKCATFWLPSAAWNMDTHDQNDVVGLGFQTALGTMRLGIDYTYAVSKTSINYNYGAGTATAAAVPQLGLTSFPDMTLVQNTVVAHLLVPIQKKVSAHVMVRHESGKIKDWHYDGIPIGASAAENNATLLLDAGPQNYHTNVVGLFVQFKL
jgi:hypothetical protein